ncbi:MAG: D-sedoheptulose 7-phosphate isomerase [Candidatus Cloacimonetes bacterium]|nr:D-sedoheptulose 7-phosphate isomerase [Candidatus Cloacimonadota bacterium]
MITVFLEDDLNIAKVVSVSEMIADCFKSGGKILICGNGGSLCDAMHFAEEFTGRFRKNRPALPAIALADSSHITCVANDFGFNDVFSRGVEAFGKSGDVLVVLSTSGNSENIRQAVIAAQSKGMKTISLLGKDGGITKGSCEIEFIIEGKTSDRIQEIHMTILHIVIEGVERLLFPENYRE